jgi:hypothetical protein
MKMVGPRTVSEVFVEVRNTRRDIDAAAAFCKTVTGYPMSDVFFPKGQTLR